MPVLIGILCIMIAPCVLLVLAIVGLARGRNRRDPDA